MWHRMNATIDPWHANCYKPLALGYNELQSKFSEIETGLHPSRESESGKIGQSVHRSTDRHQGKHNFFSVPCRCCVHVFVFGSWIWHTISLHIHRTAEKKRELLVFYIINVICHVCGSYNCQHRRHSNAEAHTFANVFIHDKTFMI